MYRAMEFLVEINPKYPEFQKIISLFLFLNKQIKILTLIVMHHANSCNSIVKDKVRTIPGTHFFLCLILSLNTKIKDQYLLDIHYRKEKKIQINKKLLEFMKLKLRCPHFVYSDA